MDAGLTKALNACALCSKRKRRCDRTLPRCSTCASKGVDCDYSLLALASVPQEYHPGGEDHEASRTLIRLADHNLEFPSMYFLDSKAFQQSGMHIPRINFSITPFITDYIGEPQALTVSYFQRVHWWMPIVSNKHLYDDLLNPLTTPSSEISLLLLAMKVLLWHPSTQQHPADPKTQEYLTAKQVLMEAASAGVLTIQLLQAQVLLVIYELGHAIYPAAYLSIGSCARYGIALGADKSLQPHEHYPQIGVLELEERRRTWWAILMLDRFMQLGNPGLALSTDDPKSDSLLPSDDGAFDQGTLTSTSFTVSSSASVEMGMLARMCQAAFLLGRVHRHNREEWVDESDRLAESSQLDRTIRSLINLTYIEGEIRRMAICGQTAMCYSALIALHDPNFARTDPEHFTFAMDLLKPVADTMSWKSGIFLSGVLVSVEDASPLLLLWAYQAATIYNRLLGRYGMEALAPLATMREKLQIMSNRWKAGDAYLQIMDSNNVCQI